MNFKLPITLMFSLMLALKLSESAKALIRADSLKVKGSKFVKAKSYYQNVDNGSFIVNSTIRNLQTIDKEMHFFVLRVNKDDHDKTATLVIWESKIDICRMLQGVRSSIIAKVIFENFLNSMNNSLIECPIPIGIYSHTNQLITNTYLPPFPSFRYPSGVIKFFFKNTVRAILKGRKKFVFLYEYEMYGTAFNADMFNKTI